MFYLMHYLTGAPALALFFSTEDAAYDACAEYFGEAAWNNTIILATTGTEEHA